MERSSGGVIFHDGKYLVLKYGLGHWGFVKGHVEPGESVLEAFLREAQEEAGLPAQALRILPGFEEGIHYLYTKDGRTVYKEVSYLLAESMTATVVLSSEHKDFAWLPYAEAYRTVTYSEDQGILEKAHEFLARSKGP